MNVLFVTAGDRTRASSRLRVYELIPYLEQKGISAETIALPDLEGGFDNIYKKSIFALRVLYGAMRNDIVYIQTLRLPIWFTKLLSGAPSTLVYDFDDAVHRSPPGSSIDKQAVRRANTLIKSSDMTVAGSRELLKYAQQYTDKLECIHTGIPQGEYTKYQKVNNTNSESIVFGWIGNPENLHYLSDIESQIDRMLEEHNNTQLNIITGKNTPVRPLKHREGKDVEYIEWSLDSAIADLSKADIGIRPLRDDKWTRSKGGFTSVIECLALGIPVVASPVGFIKYLIEDKKNGYLVKDCEWAEMLSTVVTKPEQIAPMRKSAIKTVSKYDYWSEDTADALIELLYEIVE